MDLTELNRKVSLKVLFQEPSSRIQVLGKGVDTELSAKISSTKHLG